MREIPEGFVLEHGIHPTFESGACALELVAWMACEPHSDHPACVCPVIAAFVRSWNDGMDDRDRNRLLVPILPRLIGTSAGPQVEEKRAYMALDWLVRTHTPAFLRLTPELREHAEALSSLPEITIVGDAVTCTLSAARDAARAAAGVAAMVAAMAAVWFAAWDAARDAARAAAGDAAWAAARDTAEAAARDTAEAAAGAAAGVAALRPTVETLQVSAVELIGRMIGVRT